MGLNDSAVNEQTKGLMPLELTESVPILGLRPPL